ncbi:MAG: HEAT repeat domain-containing protein [Verrucomicrobia bacterium]|nr:HEAT repeat domain-containing protein [Verrucomicrobiota bacterium]
MTFFQIPKPTSSSADSFLPLPARNEWGEDRGEGKRNKDGPPLPGPLLPWQGREGEIQASSASCPRSTAAGWKPALLFSVLIILGAFTGFSSFADDKPKTIPELIKELDAEDKFVKRKAAEDLGQMGAAAKPAVLALVRAMEDRDQQVWFHSVMALARIGPDAEEATPALIAALDTAKSPRGRDAMRRQVWYRTAYALGRIGPAAIPSLLKALDDEKTSVRSGAAKALGFMGPAAKETAPHLVGKLNDPESEVRQQGAEALSQIGPPAIPLLIPALSAPETPTRAGATLALGLIGPPAKGAAQPLADLFRRETDSDVRAVALEALSRIRYDADKFVPLLLSALRADTFGVRHAAVNGLLLLPDTEKTVVPPLLEVLKSGDSFAKEQAAHVLGRIGSPAQAAIPLLIDAVSTVGEEPPVFPFSEALVQIGPAAVPALIQALESRNIAEVRKGDWRIRCLMAIRESAAPALLKALSDKNATVRFAAIEILKGMKSAAKAITAPLQNLASDPVPEVRSSALLALSELDLRTDSYQPKLIEALKDESAQVRSAAALALANTGPEAKPALQPLIKALSDPDRSVQKGAARAIAAIGSGAAAAVPALTAALKERDPSLRVELVAALGKIGSSAESAVPRLIELIDDGGNEVRTVLFASLGHIGPGAKAAVSALSKAVQDASPEIRAHAVAALAKIASDPKMVLPLLEDSLNDNSPVVRKVAVEALVKFSEAADEIIPKVFALLKSGEDRPVALDALRQIKVKSVSLLTETLSNNDPSVRLFACEALGRLGPLAKESVPALKKALTDDYDIVRRQARMALRRIEDEEEKKTSP